MDKEGDDRRLPPGGRQTRPGGQTNDDDVDRVHTKDGTLCAVSEGHPGWELERYYDILDGVSGRVVSTMSGVSTGPRAMGHCRRASRCETGRARKEGAASMGGHGDADPRTL